MSVSTDRAGTLLPGRKPGSRRRAGGVPALAVGGAAGLAFHVLYDIGHGPTVVNEHGEVLGLTNDRWSHLSGAALLLLALGVVHLGRRCPTRTMRAAVWLLVIGFLVRALANWWYGCYVPGELLLLAGRALLVAAVVRTAVLPTWSVVPLAASVAWMVAFVSAPDAMYDTTVDVTGVAVSGADLLAGLTALAWVALAAGVRATDGRWS